VHAPDTADALAFPLDVLTTLNEDVPFRLRQFRLIDEAELS